MAKIPVQLPRYLIRKPKSEAIETFCNYVKSNTEDFKNGEEVVLRYVGNNSMIVSVNATIDDVEEGYVSFEIGEHDTLKIVEQEEEPEDKDVLWLSEFVDTENPVIANDMQAEIDSLKKKLKYLQDIVDKHEYSFNNALSGGNIKKNATKFSLSNLAAQEVPDDSTEHYDTGDTVVVSVKAFVGKYELEERDTLYTKQKYYLSVRGYNEAENEVSLEDCDVTIFLGETELTSETIYFESSSITTLDVYVLTPESATVESHYTITFSEDEEPSYYTEPSYHQFATKNAKDFEELTKYIDNLAVNEFCWCIADNTLYYRAESANHSIQLFKVNGNGSVDPEVKHIVFEITDRGVLVIMSESEDVHLSEDGILYLVGDIDENGILHLNNR